MQSEDVRRRFVRYFEGLGHLHLPSASLVVQGDPSVLLTSAGMQPFKPFYLDPSVDYTDAIIRKLNAKAE